MSETSILHSALLADDLQDAGMRHASLLRHGSQALTVRNGLPNGNAPLLLGSGASTGGPLYAGSHLAGSFDSGAKSVDGLGTAGIVKRGRDAESASLVAEAVVRGLLVAECGRDLHHGSSFVGVHRWYVNIPRGWCQE